LEVEGRLEEASMGHEDAGLLGVMSRHGRSERAEFTGA
jgi:hypothetical protein